MAHSKLIKSKIIFLMSMLGRRAKDEEDVYPHEAYQMIQDNKDDADFLILDVRTQDEVLKSHIPYSFNLDYYQPDFKEKLKKLDKNKTYLVYCRSGVRSKETVKIMKNLGFTKIYNLLGGIKNWRKCELPLE